MKAKLETNFDKSNFSSIYFVVLKKSYKEWNFRVFFSLFGPSETFLHASQPFFSVFLPFSGISRPFSDVFLPFSHASETFLGASRTFFSISRTFLLAFYSFRHAHKAFPQNWPKISTHAPKFSIEDIKPASYYFIIHLTHSLSNFINHARQHYQ